MIAEQCGQVLSSKFAKFFHAINLKDFEAYCARRSILSRLELTKFTPNFTPFYSDELDKVRGVWDRVFGNLQDYGQLFWAAPNCIPNAYGPITLVLGRNVWTQASDIAVSRRTAAAKGFELSVDRMSPEQLNSCYELHDNKWWRLNCSGLEVSLGTSFLSLDFVDKVIVEPVTADLLDQVRTIWTSSSYDSTHVESRTLGKREVPDDRSEIFAELVQWSLKYCGKIPPAGELRKDVPNRLHSWATGLRDSQWAPLRQWLEYTYNGTLR
jgi:DNA-directed RNA polymerase subunit N (RpoN/RPB10)